MVHGCLSGPSPRSPARRSKPRSCPTCDVPLARFPDSGRLTRLIRTLALGNPRFADLWASGTVGAHREDHKIVAHPTVGPIAVDCDILTDSGAELKIVILSAAPGSEDETKLRLALLAGAPDPTSA